MTRSLPEVALPEAALPKAPEFGEALPPSSRSQAVLDFLALRRSASARDLQAPGPTAAELEDLLRLAARVPDHGKLSPWRFIVFEGEAKAAFVGRLETLAREGPDAEKRQAALHKIRTPPMSVAVVSRHVAGAIPEWEQRLSAGAVCENLLIAALASGFGANWITDWYAYDARVDALLGLAPGERVAGWMHIGTAAAAPLERVRPDVAAITSRWSV